MKLRSSSNRRAFLMADMLIGLIVLGTLAAALFVAMHRTSIANRRLLDTRRAVEIAESSLAALQAGRPMTAVDPETTRINFKPLDSATEPSTAGKWIRVTVRFNSAHADLLGLVPKGAAIPANGPEESR